MSRALGNAEIVKSDLQGRIDLQQAMLASETDEAQKSILRSKIADQESAIAVIDKWIVDYHDFASRDPEPLREGSPGASTTPVRNPKKEIVAAEAHAILKAANRPVHLLEILTELDRRGLTIQGKRPHKVLMAMLFRAGRAAMISGPINHHYRIIDPTPG